MTDPSAATTEAIVRVGDVIANKFVVERVLGEGGMGVVVAAHHVHLEERVALKFLRPQVSNPEMVERFAQEARAAVKLKSEHVARVLDVGIREDGVPFIVMEYLEGQDLAAMLRVLGPLTPENAADLMIQACEGLAEAHARGIVHRDIKLENLFLADHGEGWRTLKILDFGISKAVLTGSAVPKNSNIRTQNLMGSPCYMSPEQLRSTQSVDHRSDLWSLGVVMYELLTGASAYNPEQTLSEVIVAILERPAPRVRDLRPDVPPELDEAVSRCLQHDREQRFQNAAELAIALMPLAPKRARARVERALAVTRAAGLANDRLVVPASLAPPAPARDGTTSLPIVPSGRSSQRYDQGMPAQRASGPALGPAESRIAASLSQTALIPAAAPLTPPAPAAPQSGSAAKAAAALVVLLLGVAATLWISTRSHLASPPAVASAPAPSSTASAATLVATPPSEPSQAVSHPTPDVAPPSIEPSPAPAVVTTAAATRTHAVPAPRPPRSPSAPPAETDLNIRMSR